MSLSRRGFLGGMLGGSAAVAVGAPVAAGVRKAVKEVKRISGVRYYPCERDHVLGWRSPAQMMEGLPAEWQEWGSYWILNKNKVEIPVEHENADHGSCDFIFGDGFKLPSGKIVKFDWRGAGKQIKTSPEYRFMSRWVEKYVKIFGEEAREKLIDRTNLGPALMTNIHLFRMAVKYVNYRPKS
jgi:hypothetical protein